jgi:hypothetical protein
MNFRASRRRRFAHFALNLMALSLQPRSAKENVADWIMPGLSFLDKPRPAQM